MPKQTFNINRFDGGMNTEANPRDIPENQFVVLSGVYVDKFGILRTGSTASAAYIAEQTLTDDDYVEGAGLFSSGTDYQWDGTQNSDTYFHVINSGEDLYIYDGTNWQSGASGTSTGGGTETNVNKWLDNDNALELGEANRTNTEPIYYFADNALRVTDASFNSTNSTQWIGLIDRELFKSGTADGAVHYSTGWANATDTFITQSKWFIEDQYIRPPFSAADCGDSNARNIWYSDTNTTEHDNADHWPTSTHGGSVSFTVQQANAGTISESLKTTWYLGVSYIYDGDIDGCQGQESNITSVKSESDDYTNAEQFDFSAYNYPVVITPHFRREHDNASNYYWNPRVTGMRIYISEKDTGPSTTGHGINPSTWLRIAEIDMTNGRWRQYCQGENNVSSDNSLKALGDGDGTTAHQIVTATNSVSAFLTSAVTQTIHFGICLAELPSESYYSLNGFETGSLIDVQYKTATIVNRSVYIGNVYDNTNSKTYGDRIMRTPSGKYDTFSLNFFVDVIPGDGDSIVKLESYSDRLFVFKGKALYIVNVSQGSEFIEGEYQGMGIEKRFHSVKTEFGILWMNQNGVYHFTGSSIENLTDKLIKSDWESFFNSDASIGYDLQSKHLIIDSCTKAANNSSFTAFGLSSGNRDGGHALIYDFKVGAWVFLNGYFGNNIDRSNMVISANDQKLIWYRFTNTEDVLSYNDNSGDITSAKYTIQTKDFDFGNPQQKKTIYKVYITYKTGGTTHVQVKFDTNGETNFAKVFKNGTNFTSNELDNAGSGDWTRAELVPDVMSQAKNIYSFALKFTNDGTVPATFQISDISIVYRKKGMR
jgi:hypothetical protein